MNDFLRTVELVLDELRRVLSAGEWRALETEVRPLVERYRGTTEGALVPRILAILRRYPQAAHLLAQTGSERVEPRPTMPFEIEDAASADFTRATRPEPAEPLPRAAARRGGGAEARGPPERVRRRRPLRNLLGGQLLPALQPAHARRGRGGGPLRRRPARRRMRCRLAGSSRVSSTYPTVRDRVGPRRRTARTPNTRSRS